MSLFTTLTTSVTGMSAQASSIATVSNNLANTSTTAYKAKSTLFEELVDSSTSRGNGVSSLVKYDNDAQGLISNDSVATYMALSGNGYFAVKTASENTDGSLTFSNDVYYTRSGDFTLDEQGYLQNSEGYYLLGWSVNPETSQVVLPKTLRPVQISTLTDAAIATSKVDYAANLPAGAATGTTTSSSAVTIYDSLGAAHTLSYSWTKAAATNTWDLTVRAPGGAYDAATSTTGDYTTTIAFTFNSSGGIESIDDSGTNYDVNGTSISFNLSYPGATTQTLASNFSHTTQYADSAITIVTFDQNGVASGMFSSLTIDTSGNVEINYDNSQSKTYYEVPVAMFTATDYLEEFSGNAYKETTASGGATYVQAGTSGAGKVSSSALEQSNVDIATEFTTMIQAQQIYSANAKAISTVDSMLQQLEQLKN